MEKRIQDLLAENEKLRLEVAVLRHALNNAGIPIPETPEELETNAQMMLWAIQQAAQRK